MCTRGDAAELPGERAHAAVAAVLAPRVRDYSLAVTSASGRGDNYLGVLYRISAVGRSPGGGPGALQLILKVPPAAAVIREKFPVDKIYAREIFGYTKLLPELCAAQERAGLDEEESFRFIRCYDVCTQAPHELIILQDMSALGFEMANRRHSLDLAHEKLGITALAHFHALSFYMRSERPERFAELAAELGPGMDFGREQAYFLELARDRALNILEEPELVEKVKSFGVDLYDKMMDLLSPKDHEPYTVICHGDCWINNILFKYKNGSPVDIRLLDWQILRHSTPVTDLAYFIFTSTDEDFRRLHFEELLAFYHSTLCARLTQLGVGDQDLYPEDVFRQQVKAVMPIGLIMCFMLIPIIMSEVEDTMDMEEVMKKEKLEIGDLKFENEISSKRYEQRMRGIIRDFVRLEYI